jgi:hypothetical protein
LQSSCSIEGRVTAGGVAVAGARLRLRGNDSSFFFGPETGRSANTDTDGRYRLGDVEPGDYDLSITAPNVGVPIVVRVSLSAGQSLVKDVELPLGVISGTVVTQGSGKPRADIQVRLTPDTGDDSTSELFSSEEIIIGGAGSSPSVFSATVSSSRRSTAVTTDERGYYEFLHVAPGIYRVSISGGDVIRTSKDHLEVSEGGKLENVNFVAASGSSLTIEASSSEGPPKHFLVTLEGVDPLTYKGETDFLESGKSTTIDGLAPGQYLLRVRRPGRLGLDNSEPRRIQITSGSHQTVTVGD